MEFLSKITGFLDRQKSEGNGLIRRASNVILDAVSPTAKVVRYASQVSPSTTKNFAKEFAQGSVRSATSIINTLKQGITGRPSVIQPTGRLETALAGNKPIGDVGQLGSDFVKDFGGSARPDRPGTQLLGVALASLDTFTGGEATKGSRIAINIARESKSIKKISDLLSTFRLSEEVTKEIAPKLRGVKDPNQVATIIRNAEIVSRVEEETNKIVPTAIRREILKQLEETPFNNVDEMDSYVKKTIEEIKKSAPKNQAIAPELKPLEVLARDSKNLTEYRAKVEEIFNEFKKAEDAGDSIPNTLEYKAYKSVLNAAESETPTNLSDVFRIAKNLQKEIPKGAVSGDDVAYKLKQMGSDGGVSDFLMDTVRKENYRTERVLIDDLVENDPGLKEYITNTKGKLRRHSGQETLIPPIVTSKGEVWDGYNRIAKALKAGETEIDILKGINPKAELIAKVQKAELGQAQKLAKGAEKKVSQSKATGKVNPKKVVTNEKAALKKKLATEEKAANRAKASTKKADYKAMDRAMTAAKRQAKKSTTKAKSTGKKIGIFQQRQRDKNKIKAIYYKFRNKTETLTNFRKSVRQYASKLPKRDRDRILSKVRFSEMKSFKSLQKLLSDVDRADIRIQNEVDRLTVLRETRALQKVIREKGMKPEVYPIIRERFGKIVKNKDGKLIKTLNLDMIKRLPKESLEEINDIMRKSFKSEPPKDYAKGIDYAKMEAPGTSKSKAKISLENTVKVAENTASSIFTNIKKYGGEEFFYKLRRIQRDETKRQKKYEDVAKNLVKMTKRMKSRLRGNKGDYNQFAHALANQDFDTARSIATKYKMPKTMSDIENAFKTAREDMIEAGIKVGKLENFFSRSVVDYDGLYKAFREKSGLPVNVIKSELSKIARSKYKKVSDLTDEERGEALTNLIFGRYRVAGGKGNFQLARKFKELPSEYMKFYAPPEEAFIKYLTRANERISTFKILGKENYNADIIESFVDGMDMLPSYRLALADNLNSYLTKKTGENAFSSAVRGAATISLLSHFNSALTQIADIGFNWNRHGLMRAVASLFRKKPFKRDEMLYEISHELGQGALTTLSLKAVGLDLIDKVNAQAFMGEVFRDSVRIARKGKGEEYEQFVTKVKKMYGDDWSKALDDFKAGKANETTELMSYNEILDISPRARSEMPKAYLDHPNARAFYSLKSYGIKVWDVYRNRVFREPNKKKALWQFVKMTTIFGLAGASAKQVKDYWNDQDPNFSDNFKESVLNLAFASQYDSRNIKDDGLLLTMASKILPVTRPFDDAFSDIYNAGDGKGLQSVRDIPVIGREIYNRAGRGVEAQEKKRNKPFEPKELAKSYAENDGFTTEQLDYIRQLKRTNPAAYSRVRKYIKWEKMGLTDKEKDFASMGVSDGERAEAIVKYLKKTSDPLYTYRQLKRAGIITDDVKLQITQLGGI